MDAPTTASADNGTSDGSGGGGWFKPRKQPEGTPGGEQAVTEGSRLAALRPVGRPVAGGATSSSPDAGDPPSVTEPPPDRARIPTPAPAESPAPPPLPPLPLAPASPLPAPFSPAPTASEPRVRPPFASEPLAAASFGEELGFKVTGEAEMVCGRFTPNGPAPKVATRPATAEDLAEIIQLDEEVFGTDRTHIITRLPAFADQLRVAEENGRIIGYAAAWPNMATHVVGPLIARDTETAKALIASLAAHSDRPLRTDIDVRHEELLAWVKERGLAPLTFNAVMAYGMTELPGDWTRRFAPLTVAAG